MAVAPLIVAVALATTEMPARPVRALGLGWTTGAVYFGGTLYWVVGVMQTFGNLALPVAFLVGVLLAAYLAIYPAIFAWLLRQSLRRLGLAGVWLAPLLWVTTEWGRSMVVIGFPWALVGSSQATVLPVAQFSSVAGVYGLSCLVVLVGTAAAVVTLTRRRAHWIGAGLVVLFVVLVAVAGAWRIVSGPLDEGGVPLRVGLVQGSVEQAQKWDPRFRDEIMARYIALSRQVIAEGADIVIWPEASTPFYFDLDADLAAPIRRLAAESRTPFVIGTDEVVPGGGGTPRRVLQHCRYSSTPRADRVRTYRKMQLVPFGEYVPLKVCPVLRRPSRRGGERLLRAGTEPVVFDVDGRRLSVAICYESIYPEIARAFVAGGSQLLVTITNDAWFGRSSAAYQHFEQGALRGDRAGPLSWCGRRTPALPERSIRTAACLPPQTCSCRRPSRLTCGSRSTARSTAEQATWSCGCGVAATAMGPVAGRAPRPRWPGHLRNGIPMNLDELVRAYSDLSAAPPNFGGGFDEARLQQELTDLEAQASAPDFWKDQAVAQKILQRRRRLEDDRALAAALRKQTDDLAVLVEWARQGEDVAADLERGLEAFARDVQAGEVRTMLSGEMDRKNAIITIHPGAGGTESQDWAEMLLRMYLRWIERRGFKREVIDLQPGDEAGIKSATINVVGRLRVRAACRPKLACIGSSGSRRSTRPPAGTRRSRRCTSGRSCPTTSTSRSTRRTCASTRSDRAAPAASTST